MQTAMLFEIFVRCFIDCTFDTPNSQHREMTTSHTLVPCYAEMIFEKKCGQPSLKAE